MPFLARNTVNFLIQFFGHFCVLLIVCVFFISFNFFGQTKRFSEDNDILSIENEKRKKTLAGRYDQEYWEECEVE